jgi:pyridoxamine 5'-phosphate oxidase
LSFRSKLRTILTLGHGVTRGLTELAAGDDPIALFDAWFAQAEDSGMALAEALALATCSDSGSPSVRMVLLKGFDAHGFVFYTSYESPKARDLAANPDAALVFHWPIHGRQVRITGRVGKTGTDESAAYFASRPRGSQLAAWASAQSEPLASREEFEGRYCMNEDRFRGRDVPLPPFWGGYRLAPERIEFFQSRVNRLHDRLVYTRVGDGWERVRLYP